MYFNFSCDGKWRGRTLSIILLVSWYLRYTMYLYDDSLLRYFYCTCPVNLTTNRPSITIDSFFSWRFRVSSVNFLCIGRHFLEISNKAIARLSTSITRTYSEQPKRFAIVFAPLQIQSGFLHRWIYGSHGIYLSKQISSYVCHANPE